MPVILDTDILSEYLKGHDQNVLAHAARYALTHDRFTLTSVTVYEMVFGLELKGAQSQLKRVRDWFGRNESITPSDADYVTPASVRAAARRQGHVLELPDCLIAAVASRLQVPLATGNTADFEAIRDTGLSLTLENWREL